MGFKEPSYTIGVEEEYLLVNVETRELAAAPPPEMMIECEKRVEHLVKPEFLRSQIEISTDVCASAAQAREQLAHLRATVSEVAGKYGLAPIAASTHPFSEWQAQYHTDAERYHVLANAMQGVARRLLICGMHVHVAIEDEDLRIDVMNQASYFLPHLLALSTSSPYWRGEDSGLMSYRLSVFDELPRTGLPERFESHGEYMRHVDILTKAGVIEDASMLWWDIRPSQRFPTLEMRISDVCTNLDDAVAIAALYQCLIRSLVRLRRENRRWRLYATMLINENRWRAQRYGLDEGLLDFGRGDIVNCRDLMAELLDLVAEDAEALGCVAELAHIQTILQRGTSAHRQRKTFETAKEDGKSDPEALDAVVDMLVDATMEGV